MTISEMLLLIALLGMIGIILARVYNLMKLAQFYTMEISVILLITFGIAYLINIMVFLKNNQDNLYLALFYLATALFSLNFFLFLAELILFFVKRTMPADSFKSSEH